jgi:hypothetical protein
MHTVQSSTVHSTSGVCLSVVAHKGKVVLGRVSDSLNALHSYLHDISILCIATQGEKGVRCGQCHVGRGAYRELHGSRQRLPVAVGVLAEVEGHRGPVRGATLPECCLERQLNLAVRQVAFWLRNGVLLLLCDGFGDGCMRQWLQHVQGVRCRDCSVGQHHTAVPMYAVCGARGARSATCMWVIQRDVSLRVRATNQHQAPTENLLG